MPHEKIHRTVPNYRVETHEPTKTSPGLVAHVPDGERTELVQVTWNEGQYVQIGIDLGKPFLFAEDSVLSAEDGPERTSLWFDLSRPEINRLIKTLRRARDAAYGRDE